jgi:hypothetical protein
MQQSWLLDGEGELLISGDAHGKHLRWCTATELQLRASIAARSSAGLACSMEDGGVELAAALTLIAAAQAKEPVGRSS